MKQIVLGIDPGRPGERDRAAWAALTLEPSGAIGLFLEARDQPKPELGRFLDREALLADERLRSLQGAD